MRTRSLDRCRHLATARDIHRSAEEDSDVREPVVDRSQHCPMDRCELLLPYDRPNSFVSEIVHDNPYSPIV